MSALTNTESLKWFVLPRYCKNFKVYIFTVKLSESLIALTVYLPEEIKKSFLSKYTNRIHELRA